jgi:hypothetical protein
VLRGVAGGRPWQKLTRVALCAGAKGLHSRQHHVPCGRETQHV